MLSFLDMPRAFVTRSQNPDVNSNPLSVTMFVGNLWGRTMFLTKLSASASRSIVLSPVTKCPN